MNCMNKQTIIAEKIVKHEALTFDDILLLPNFTDFKRQDVDLSTTLHPQLILKIPVISSPMDTVTEDAMAIAVAQAGGLGIIHRNISVERQVDIAITVKKTKSQEAGAVDAAGKFLVGAAVGVGSDFDERVKALAMVAVDVIVIDSGHGHTQFMIDAIKSIKGKYPKMVVMAGNIATYDGAKALIGAGADILRVGMGPGSICTTRIVTGMGVPQLSAIAAAVRATEGTDVTVVADGGIRQIGDMAKALAFGASAVMLGSLFARFEESPGDVVTVNDKKYKMYRGMGSISAMKKGGAERYGQSRDTHEKKLIAEGVEGLVEFQGSAVDYLEQIAGSLRSSLYYLGAKNITQFFQTSRAIKISNAGLSESHPHNITMTNMGGNYTK